MSLAAEHRSPVFVCAHLGVCVRHVSEGGFSGIVPQSVGVLHRTGLGVEAMERGPFVHTGRTPALCDALIDAFYRLSSRMYALVSVDLLCQNVPECVRPQIQTFLWPCQKSEPHADMAAKTPENRDGAGPTHSAQTADP